MDVEALVLMIMLHYSIPLVRVYDRRGLIAKHAFNIDLIAVSPQDDTGVC